VGVNLNLNKACTFNCRYCQIDRRVRRRGLCKRAFRRAIGLNVLADELRLALSEAASGRLWREPRYAATPPSLRRINDIAFSGDGEPTALSTFDAAVATATSVKRQLGMTDVKLIVITNAAELHRSPFQRAIPTLRANQGVIWAKLDAGTERLFRRINRPRTNITLEDICRNITAVSKRLPVVIQSLFFRSRGQAPSAADVAAYCWRLKDMLAAGARIRQAHVHTIARRPAESDVRWLTNREMDALGAAIAGLVNEIDVAVFYGADMPPQTR